MTDIDDPLLAARIKSALGDVRAPESLVASVRRRAVMPALRPRRSQAAEVLPALASVALIGSLLAGALGNFPIMQVAGQLLAGGGRATSSPLLPWLALGLPIAGLLTFEFLRGAPVLRRSGR